MPLHLTRQLKRAFEGDPRNCILFVGAGLSALGVRKGNRGLPTWKQLIHAMIEDLKDSEKCDKSTLEIIDEKFKRNDYLKITQIFREKTRPDQYAAFLKEQLDPNDLIPSKIHELILSIDFKGIITTNFDCVFEVQSNRLQPLIYPQSFDDISAFRRHGFFAKIHGCIRNTANPADNLILSDESYISLRSNQKYKQLLQSIILLNPLLTVGFSLTDPDFLGLIDDLKDIYDDTLPTIYSLMLTDDESLKAEWRDKGVEIISYNDHNELITFFSELKDLTNINGTIQDLKPTEKESEINYEKFLVFWKHTQSNEELFKAIKKQINKFKTVKEKEAFLLQLLAVIDPDEAYLLIPQLIELKTPISIKVLHSLLSKLDIDNKWHRITPSEDFVPVHSWLLKHWHDNSKYDYKYSREDFVNRLEWLFKAKWVDFGINIWETFSDLLNQILVKEIQWKLDDLYSASEFVEGAAERIEQIVFAPDFVKEDDSSKRWYKDWFIRTKDNIQYTKFKIKVRAEGIKNYKKHLIDAVKANKRDYLEFILKRIFDQYIQYTHLTLHSSSGLYNPHFANEILQTLAAEVPTGQQLYVLWAIDLIPEEGRGRMSFGDDYKNLREGLFFPLWWRYSNKTRAEYFNYRHKQKMHSIVFDEGNDVLLTKFLGLSYDADKDFVNEFNCSLENHKSTVSYENYEPRPLQELWRYRELKYFFSDEIPPEIIRRVAVNRVDWENLTESSVRWEEAKSKAQELGLNSTIRKHFSKSKKNYVLDNLLGWYSPNSCKVILFSKIIDYVANDLNIDEEALGTVVYIHLTIHAYCHVARDLSGRDWFDFSLPQPEQPIFKLSKLHETIAQYYTFKLIEYLKDEKLKKAFLEFEKYSENIYMDWRKVEHYSLEDMRTILIKYRKTTTDFPDL